MNATYTHTHTHTDTPTDTPTDTHRGRTTLVAHLGRGGYRRNRFDRSSTSDGAPLPTATEPRIPSDPLPKKKQQQTKTWFYRVSPSFTGFNLFLPDFPRCNLVKPDINGFLPSFTKFYWVFTGF